MLDLTSAPIEFVGSFPDPLQRLDPVLPEIAFLGRSNVGKSSLINALVGRKIARISATPGKTQYLNVFRFPAFYLLDLPGYGYARASLAERRRFRGLVQGTIERRPTLSGVVWLLDIRHSPSTDDLAIRDVLFVTGRATLIALTKADKLPRAQRLKAERDRTGELEVAPEAVIPTSAKGLGIPELTSRLELLLDPASRRADNPDEGLL